MMNLKSKPQKILAVLLSVILAFSALTAIPITASAYVNLIDNYYTDDNGIIYDLVQEGLDTGYTAYVSGFTGDKTEIVIPSTIKGYTVTTVNGSAFENCKKIKKVIIPDTVDWLGAYAFENCISLEYVDLGNGIEEINEGVFKNCQSLKSITIPKQITYIYNSNNYADFAERYPFSGCVNLATINFNAKNCTQTMEFREISTLTTLNIGSSVESLPQYAFYECESVENINIENGILTIPAKCFYGCTGLTSITLPDSIMAVGESAFEKCTNLKSVNLSKNLNTISASAFSDCTAIETLHIPSSMRTISEKAFLNCTSLTALTFDNGLLTISDQAFYNCKSINKITLPASVTSIGVQAFAKCTGLVEVSLPNKLKTIEQETFSGCSSLNNVKIPDSVTTIDSYAFNGCTALKNITFGTNLTSIGYGAFMECTGLTKLTIPQNVKTINEEAFLKCQNLSDLTIENGVQNIKTSAFYGCLNLKSVTIPQSVTALGNKSFGYYGNDYAYKISDFTIKGYSGTIAEDYAENNGFKFIDLSYLQPTSVTISSAVTLGKDETITLDKLNAKISPSTAITDLYYTTSDSTVAYIDSYNGKLTASKIGTAYVTVHTSNGKTATCKVTVKPAPTSVKTNPTSLTLGKGETYTISESTNSGSFANANNLKWSSSNTNVATVTKGSANKAKITAKGVGTAYIKITLYNGKTAQCKVTVKSAPTSVKTNPTSLTLGKGETYTISESTNSGTYANADNLKWSSSNTNVATVTKGNANKAKITAKGVGTAYIKITLYNGKTAQCKVTVKSAPSSVKTNPTSLTLGKGETYTISESTNSGSFANADNLKWSSSNTNVATVTKGNANKAKITAKGVGTAYIKITLYNGKTAQCKVTVKSAPSSVKLSKTSITLKKGQTYTISESTNSGTYANAANLKWSSSNTGVATVTKGSANKATITAKSKGTTYVKITLYNGKTAQCKVTVK